MYKSIERAIEFAIQEVRHARYEYNQEEGLDLEVFKKLERIQQKLREALEEI